MKQAAFLSAFCHIIFILLVIFGVPYNKTLPDLSSVTSIPVELLPMTEIAQAPNPVPIPVRPELDQTEIVKSAAKPAPPENKAPIDVASPPEPAPPVSPPPTPVTPQPVTPPEPVPEPKPDFDTLQSVVEKLSEKIEPQPVSEPVPEPKPLKPEKTVDKPVKKPKPVIAERPKDDKKDNKKDRKEDSSFNSVLKNIAKLKPASDTADQNSKDTVSSQASSGGVVGPTLTTSEIAAVQKQIESAWSINPGARNLEQLVITLEIWVNPDRTVRDVRVIDDARFADNPFYRSLKESAIRAVRDPRCNPLRLPANQYERWKHIIFNFRPPV